jgi:uncharacterized protein (DUF488 family)
VTDFFTIGHSTRPLDIFGAMLTGAQIAWVADIRKIPKSRTNPQFNGETLPAALKGLGIGYEHIAALGGRRGRTRDEPPDVNGLWTNRSFHNYADYALSGEFRAGLAHLVDKGRRQRCALMCSEAVWWRCHRRIVTDYLLARGEAVFHIMGEGRCEPARLTKGAVVQPDGTVLYPAAI